jgi:hypothetical protein
MLGMGAILLTCRVLAHEERHADAAVHLHLLPRHFLRFVQLICMRVHNCYVNLRREAEYGGKRIQVPTWFFSWSSIARVWSRYWATSTKERERIANLSHTSENKYGYSFTGVGRANVSPG